VTGLWTATIALATYFADLSAAMVHLFYEYVIQPTVAGFEKVGSAIANAANALGLWLVTNVLDKLFDAVIAPLVSDAEAFAGAIGGAIVNATTNPTAAADAFWAYVSSPTFGILLVVGTLIEGALGVMEAFSLGTGFLVAFLISLLLTGLLESKAGQGVSDYVQALGNETHLMTGLYDIVPSTYTSGRDYLKDLSNLMTTGTTEWAALQVVDAGTEGPEWSDVVGTALGLLGLEITLGANGLKNSTLEVGATVAGLIVDGASVLVDEISLSGAGGTPELIQDLVVLGLDAGTFECDLYLASEGK